MKKSELKALIKEVIGEVGDRGEGQEYMLYDNRGGESISFGTIDYIAAHLSDYITNGHSEKHPIHNDEQSVMRVVRQHRDLMLMKVVK